MEHLNYYRTMRITKRNLVFYILALLAAFPLFCAPFTSLAQTPAQPSPTPTTQQQPMGGVSTGAAATYTSKRTVGIVDATAPAVFEDMTAQTALKNFQHHAGGAAKDYIIETPSGGVAIFDYDNDGKPDIYLLNGSTFAAIEGKEKPPRAALFHNLGNWKFEDVTDKAGVANERWGFGVAVGDYDNDGRPDVYVRNYGVAP